MMEKTDEYQTLTGPEKEMVKQVLIEGIEGENKSYDPVHGILLNIEASRIASHLGARGANYIVDAACASSVTALEAATGELLSGEHDQVIVGGVNTHLAPESFIGFAKMGTLSAVGSYPFDERADGFILGEGSVVFVLKRMKDFSQRYDAEMSALLEQLRAKEKRGEVIIKAIESSQEIVIQGLEQESATEHTIVELNDLRDQLDVYLKQNKVELEGMMDDSGKIEDLLKRVDAIRLEIATMADSAEAELRRARQAADDAEAAKAAAEGNQSNEQLIAFGIGVPALFVILLLLVLIL